MHRTDTFGQLPVLALTLATLARAPGIEPGSGHPVEPAHHRHAVLCPVYFDEREDLRFSIGSKPDGFFGSSYSSFSPGGKFDLRLVQAVSRRGSQNRPIPTALHTFVVDVDLEHFG